LSYSPSVSSPLFYFFVQSVFPAERTELFYFQPFGLFLLVPGGGIVPAFTIRALKGNYFSHLKIPYN